MDHAIPDVRLQIAHARPWLMQVARRRLRHPDLAEDAVAETLVAALERPPDFVEPMRVRAWLGGILRHKIVDQLREHSRTQPAAPLHDPDEIADEGADPAHRASAHQFLSCLDTALRALPVLQARAFLLRVAYSNSAAEVCEELGLTPNHLWVLLHRGRVRLRADLRSHWDRG